MGLERGTYGIEYDKNRKSSAGKLWFLPVIIPLVVILLILRGCFAGQSGGIYSGDDMSLAERSVPEVKVVRERPSIVAHFLRSWHSKMKGEVSTGNESAAHDMGVRRVVNKRSGNKKGSTKTGVKTSEIPNEVARLLKRVDDLEDGGDLVSARMILQKLRLRPDASVVRPLVERRIGEVNITLILSDKPMPGKLLYKIKSGDFISRLRRRYKNTEEYILRVNKIERSERIRIGQELWVLDNPIFELMIDKSDFKAVLLFNNRFFKVYTIGLGASESVPSGSYEVRSRSKSGDELSGDNYSVLLRAAGGTPEVKKFNLSGIGNESHLGMNSQEGGLMFSNAGIEELYILLPSGSMVTIVE